MGKWCTDGRVTTMLRFDGKRALVVGGTSGIGRAIALAFARAGARVAATGRRPDRTAEMAAELRACGASSLDVPCDATDGDAVRALFRAVAAEWGGLDILVAAQGVHQRQPSQQVDDASFRAVLAANLESVFTVCREAYPLLRASRGCIVTVASMGSFIGLKHAAAYTASKGGVAQLTKALAVDWAADGIRCNAIAPGWIVTPMSQALLEEPAVREAILRRTPLGRLGQADDIAGAALFLASDLAAFVTGTVLTVDGGAMASL